MCHPSVLPIVVGDSRHGCMEKMTVMMNSHRFPVHDHREPRFLVKNLQILKRCSMTTVHDYFAHIAHLSLSLSSAASSLPSLRRLLLRLDHPVPTSEARGMSSSAPPVAAAMAVDDAEEDQIASMSTEQIVKASRLLDNEIRVHKVRRPSVKPWPRVIPLSNKSIHAREKRGRKKAVTGENCARCAAVETERSVSPSRTSAISSHRRSRRQPPPLSRSARRSHEVLRARPRGFFPAHRRRGLFPGRGRGGKAGNG
jgi:hypothetical protein